MATLQAVRAHVLGLSAAAARSWGLNRAIFYAAAKRGFAGRAPAGPSGHRGRRSEDAVPAMEAFFLGDDKAYAVRQGDEIRFAIGGEVQTPEQFVRQVEARFGGTFPAAWEEAVRIVQAAPRDMLTSQEAFYQRVYRPRRDEFARRWTERAAASSAGAAARSGPRQPGTPSHPRAAPRPARRSRRGR